MILQNIVLIAAVAIPAVLLVLLRTNSAVVFFALCSGSLLVRFIGDDANLVGTVVGNNSHAVSQYAELVLLLLPAVVVAIILRKTVSTTKIAFNVLPAIAVGLVGVLLAVPLLPGGMQASVVNTEGWKLLEHSQELVLGASVLVSVVVLWITRSKLGGSGKKHH
jgi:hypothetical protein